MSARIYDYKTDVLESEDPIVSLTSHYGRQLRLYRDALSDILSIPPTKVGLFLIFTNRGIVRNVRP